MRNIIKSITCISIIFLSSCGSEPEIECSVNTVKVFNKASTNFTFSKTPGGPRLDLVTVYEGTDSSYTFSYTYATDGTLTDITRSEDGVTLNYDVTLDGSKISKFTSRTSGGVNQDEVRLIYSGDRITETRTYLANSAGTLFQVGHNAYTYDGSGNLTKRETHLDLVALFSILFGADPTTYSPLLLDNITYESSTFANPLKGHFFMDNFDLSLMLNIPQKIVSGGSTENYTIEKDGNGLPTKATAGAKYQEITYTCL